jgi:hypothetical protein
VARETDVAELVGLEPDESLLGEDLGQLPGSVGHPEPIPPPSAARRRRVALGATLTGVTLVVGVVLTAFGAVDGFATAFDPTSIAALLLGIALISTHWGWVHMAELSASRLDVRRNAPVRDRRRAWLGTIEPYARWEVSTSTGEDGSISIVTVRYRPVASGEGKFTFVREEVARELRSGDEPAAAVTERAELLRRQAALDTAQERERYAVAHDADERARIAHADEQERLAAVRAASEALSERINSNLRDPPLVE